MSNDGLKAPLSQTLTYNLRISFKSITLANSLWQQQEKKESGKLKI